MELIILLTLLLLLGLWLDGSRAKEIACQAGRRVCESMDVQFLDETVAQTRMTLQRDRRDGRVKLQRDYSFEFSSEGTQRYRGAIRLLGRRVLDVRLEPHRMHGDS